MKRFFIPFILLGCFIQLEAQERTAYDTILLLEDKIWRAEIPSEKSYTQEMEFRDCGLYAAFAYNGKEVTMEDSYHICGDTIKTYYKKEYKILELSDSTLVIRYIPQRLVIGNGPIKYINTINSPARMFGNELRLDSIWRKENIWNLGVVPIKDDKTINEPPQWTEWGTDLEKYYVSQMKYPENLLKKNVADHSVAMFAIDTLGVPGIVNILTTNYKEFDQEVIRLTKELPHCLPCRDENGKRIECFYTVYVPFLPQHYRNRVRKDSIRKEESLKKGFVEREMPLHSLCGRLIAYTTEPHLEVGVPVCYLNERGDTIVSYGKYIYCQSDTIKDIGFVYENKSKDARIVCINDAGKELFYVFKYDNGSDYIQEGLFRIMDKQGKIGFADTLGHIVIQPQYMFAYSFKNGKTNVTLKGEQKPVTGSNGEKYYWDSNDWFYIDKKNGYLTE